MPASSSSPHPSIDTSEHSAVGRYLTSHIVEKKGLDQDGLAALTRISVKELNDIMSGKAKLSANVILKLSDAFETDADFWISMESETELAKVKTHYEEIKSEVERIMPFKDLRYYYLHIKKCAGTTLIGLADKQAGVEFYHPNANGNPLTDDESLKGTARFMPFWDLEKPEQHEFLRRKSHNFIANEGHLGNYFEKLDDMIYFTVLRDPVKRTLSQFHHAKHLGAIKDDLNVFVPERARKVKWMNNFIIFQVTGEWVREYDKSAIDFAKARLEKFDHVFMQEFFSEDITQFENYGWDMSKLTSRNVRAKVKDNDQPNDETIKILTQLNQSDIELYEYFLGKRQNLSEV